MTIVQRLTTYLLSIAALILGTATCATPPPAPAPAAQVQRPIIDGVPDANPAHKAVVALTWGSGPSSFCSGTLITPDVVLTAAHCLDNISPTLLEVFFGNDVAQLGERRDVEELIYHPLWDGDNLSHGYDLGLIRLASPAPADATPVPFLPASLALTQSDEASALEFVGFGRTENDTSGIKLTAMAILGNVCDGPTACSWGGTQVAPGGFGYPMDAGGPCKGDSGGPGFIWRNGQEYVAGVTSYGDEFCDYFGVSTRPDSHQAWIEAFIARVSEDCDSPGDEDADSLADCADPDCDDHPSCPQKACLAAEEIGCGDQITDTTEGGGHHLRGYTCHAGGLELGPERAYVITAPRGLDVTVTLVPEGDVNLDLFLLPYFQSECAAWDCLDVSAAGGWGSEQIAFRARTDHGFIVVDSPSAPGPFTLTMACDTSAEDCTNNIDDDADGDTDCADSDCDVNPDCLPPDEVCVGGVDEDVDGLTDCDDPDCANSPYCAPPRNLKKGGCRQGPSGDSSPLVLLGMVLLLLWRRRR